LKLYTRTVDIPLFLEIKEDCLNELPRILSFNKLIFSRAIVLFDSNTYEIAGKKISFLLRDMGKEVEEVQIEECSIKFADALAKKISELKSEVIFGVGGGKVLDVGKYSASKEDINFVSIPTSVGHDGISSPVAVLERNGKKESLGVRMPLGIILDVDVIRTAPVRITRAGIGDLISNSSALKDWELSRDVNNENFDDFAAMLSNIACQLIMDFREKDICSLEFLKRLVKGLVLSGIAMSIAGSSRPCSGAEHEFSHALDAIAESPALHGEQVAIGCILSSYLRNEDWREIVSLFKLWGLPTRAVEIGIRDEEVIEALILAPETRPGRYTILEHIGIDKELARKAATATEVIG
jgi:glycerol-1-phosphate dehydrogenase [NAD(P)+]